jgi:hypothetical protein
VPKAQAAGSAPLAAKPKVKLMQQQPPLAPQPPPPQQQPAAGGHVRKHKQRSRAQLSAPPADQLYPQVLYVSTAAAAPSAPAAPKAAAADTTPDAVAARGAAAVARATVMSVAAAEPAVIGLGDSDGDGSLRADESDDGQSERNAGSATDL